MNYWAGEMGLGVKKHTLFLQRTQVWSPVPTPVAYSYSQTHKYRNKNNKNQFYLKRKLLWRRTPHPVSSNSVKTE